MAALERLSHSYISSGTLDQSGEEVFLDNKVNAAIKKIFAQTDKAA